MKKIVLIILDGVGIGALPDAFKCGDENSNTLKNLSKEVEDFFLPNLGDFGLGNIDSIPGIERTDYPLAYFGKMQAKSAGKDTTSGHWEITGNILEKPFPTYPRGFPDEIIEKFKEKTGRGVLGNKAASGTEIIKELGSKHLDTGDPIIYTSADSVFQVAAHEDVISLEELYEICRRARGFLTGVHGVGRVIARPFKGEFSNFYRTGKRKDFSLKPPDTNLLPLIKKAGKEVIGVGKIEDIYAGEGITRSIYTKDNTEGIEKTLEVIDELDEGIIMTNLIDFDMLYGHRNDSQGFFDALYEFDLNLPLFLANLGEEDLLIITSDHGCDPTVSGTDHTREYVPLLVYNHNFTDPKSLGIRSTFADVAQTIAELLKIGKTKAGESFADILI